MYDKLYVYNVLRIKYYSNYFLQIVWSTPELFIKSRHFKSTKMLMPQWCWSKLHVAQHTLARVTVAINIATLQLLTEQWE